MRLAFLVGGALTLLSGFPLTIHGASRFWTGLGANGNWTTAANWSNNVTPLANDFLTFPFGTPRLLTTNTFTANTLFSGIKLQDSYTLRGAAVDLTNLVQVGASKIGTLDLDVRLQAPLIFSADLNSKFVVAVNRTIALNNFDLTLDGLAAAHEFDGVISDLSSATSKVIINGAQALGSSGNTVVFNGSYVGPGPILVTNISSLALNGSSRAPVIIASTTSLSGTGSLGGLIASGRVLPGPANGSGSLRVNGTCTFSSSASFVASIAGTNAGVTYSQLLCGSNVNLGSAQLLIARSSSFFPSIGDRFTVLSKTSAGAISGTFAGLPQGASVNVDGVFYQVTYTGGDGNDVALIVTNTDTHTWDGGGANALWSNAANWEANVAPSVSNNVIFPRTAPNAVCTNDFPADTIFNSLRFIGSAATNNYPRLRGNSLRLLSGLVATNLGSQGVVALELPIKLAAAQTFTNSSTTTAIELRSNLLVQPFTLTVRGPGIFRTTGLVTGTNNASLIQVNGGHLIVNGSLDGNLTVISGGGLAGTGTVGALSMTNSSLSPGDGGTGILTVKGGLSLSSASVLNLALSNSTPGSGYDQLIVSNGNLVLGSSTLNLSVVTNLGSAIDDTFTLIKVTNPTNTVSGTFAGLAQGALVTNNGAVFTVSYSGGDGNDVTLTLANVLSTGTERFWTGADPTTNAWSFRTNWTLNTAPIQGDSLHFPIGLVSRRTNFNDLLADTTFGALRFDGDNVNDVLLGNPFRLNDGVRLEPSPNTFTLALPGVMTVSNRVTLNHPQTFTNAVDGTLRFAGGVVLGTNTLLVKVRDGTDISFDGPITGAGRLLATEAGRVNLNAANAVTGEIVVTNGFLVAKNAQALGSATAGPVRVGNGGSLRFQSTNTVFTGSLITLTGRVEVVNSPNSSLAVPIVTAGPNPVFSSASGLFTLNSPLTNTTVLTATGLRLAPGARIEGGGVVAGSGPGLNGGSFEADGTVHNLVLPGTLTGAGAIDAVIGTNLFSVVQPGSTTDPTLAFTPLQIGRLQLNNNASLRFQLFPNRAGGGPTNTSLISTSAPDLGGAKLVLTALTNLAPNQKFTLLRNDSAAPVTNTFSNLPEGGFLGASGGSLGLQISYIGGDGNDVVVTVQTNTPPVIAQPTLFVDEQTLLTYTNTAVDFEKPAQTITWNLLSAPAGVNLNATSGVLTWTPTEAQGPSTNVILVQATDNGVPPSNSTGAVTVLVREVNQPPVNTSVTNTNVVLGTTLTIQLTASDPDIPANTLTWSALLSSDATLSPNGLFTFTPTTNFPGNRIFQISVRDFNPDATIQKSLTNTFSLSVRVDIPRVVTNTNDSGPGSLRQAVLDVNNTPGPNAGGGQIGFNIPGLGPFEIFLISALPPLLHDTVIDGYTQPGSHPNTLAHGDNAQPFIELSGENMTSPTNGLSWSGPRVTLRGLVLNRWDTAIATGHFGTGGLTPNAVIEGCFIGTDPAGTVARTNRVGINFLEAFNGRIGGPAPAQRNLISGNSQSGIALVWDNSDSFLHNLIIQNNFIGTDRSGTNVLGNGGFGIASQSSLPTTNSLIADNVIGGNGQGGLQVAGSRNFVLRNRIGLAADGISAVNNSGPGIDVSANCCLIGGSNGANANFVANNNGPGVHISAGTNNTVSGNSIFRNNGLGIDLGALGPDPNDPGDLDSGPNNLQNTPVLQGQIVSDLPSVTVTGALSSAVLTSYQVEFFHSPDFAPANQPQGQTFLGSTEVKTDGNGNANFAVSINLPSLNGFITATATDPAGNTSEMSLPTGVQRADFYAGALPHLSIVSGTNQTGAANLFLPNPLVVLVTDTNGVALSNAPITFTVAQGDATLATSFTQDRFSSLPLRTTADGQAQVFCHLGPTVGLTNLITATAVSGPNSTNVRFAEITIAPQPEGVSLQGDPSSPAVNAMVDLKPIGVPNNQIEDGVILTRIDAVIDPDATVGQINSALASINGGIVTMRQGSPFITLAIPPPGSDELQAMLQILRSAPGLLFAFPGHETQPQIFPYDNPSTVPSLAALFHLLPTHFPAAWNASGLLTGCNPVKVLVVDRFRNAPPTSPLNFAGQVPVFQLSDPAPDPNETQDHGYLVAATAGALFDKLVPTGANPFSGCLDFRLIQTAGMTPQQVNQQFADHLPAGEFIVNESMGFAGFCISACAPINVELEIPTALERAVDALQWRGLTISRWRDFFMASAAGNDRTEELAPIYPGINLAAFKSEPIIATLADQSYTWIQDSTLWDPGPTASQFPSLTASPQDTTKLLIALSKLSAGALEPAENILSVGSIDGDFTPAVVQESDFSNTDPDVKAVGRNVTVACTGQTPGLSCRTVDGTSFSSPQVAGLASYLWLLSPDLRARPAADTATAIRANTRDSTKTTDIIDAYATVLSLDPTTLPDAGTAHVRHAILDVNGDGVFDEKDIQLFLDHYFVGDLPVSPTQPDFSRFDLNGDGFTGGSTTERFDLDRVGSVQFGSNFYSFVTQKIEGVTVSFDENQLTDQEILCYCAYSGLYQGDPAMRTQLLGDVCLPITVTVTPSFSQVPMGGTLQLTATVEGVPGVSQAVEWSIVTGTGATVTSTGFNQLGQATAVLTAICPDTVTVQAKSVAFPKKTGQALATITVPIVTDVNDPASAVLLLIAGSCQSATFYSCSSVLEPLDNGPDRTKVDGNNRVQASLPCSCANGVLTLPFTVFSSSQRVPNTSPCPGDDLLVATADWTGRYIAQTQTLVSASVNGSWGVADSFGSASVGAQLSDTMGHNFSLTPANPSINFQITKGTALNMDLAAVCQATSSGSGTAVTVTFTPVTPPGIFTLTPADTTVRALSSQTYAFSWTVPEPENWHDLNNLQFRIRDSNNILIWVRFNEADRTFSVYNTAARKFGPNATAGSDLRLETRWALLDLAQTTVVAAGPTSPTVTLNLALAFKPLAGNHTCIIEVAATDDAGNAAPFVSAGTLMVLSRTAEAPVQSHSR